jgi:transcriptional regulator with XRE-family HTH domain
MSIRKKSETMLFLEKITGRPLTLGSLIEAIRLGEDMTQPKFAAQLGISKSHLNDIEKGRKAVSPGRALKFAKILGYSEKQFVRLSLQAILDHDGVDMLARVEVA